MAVSHMTRAEIISGLAAHILTTDLQSEGQFPLFRKTGNEWVMSSRGSWIAGFWSGCLWLAGYATDSDTLQNRGRRRWNQIAQGLNADSVFRAMNAWYGFGPVARLTNDSEAETLLTECQSQLSATFAHWEGFPLGTAMGGGEAGNNRITIDPCAALIEMGRHADWQSMPMAHTKLMVSQLMTAKGDFYTHSLFRNAWHPEGISGEWPRGQSWGVLAMATAALYDPETYQEKAQHCCERWWQRFGVSIPFNTAQDSVLLPDASASLISVVAYLKMHQVMGGVGEWKDRAVAMLDSVLASDCVTGNTEGIRFSGCCYATAANRQDSVEMPYGYFFLLQALLIVSGRVEASAF
ncbi:hypothetical protein L6J37_19670 [Photobacterium sp. WH77]|uniref:Glycosyl hydrolase n=1 Tax=Photobacterium arenosum TaxID=2774143 RepID=A0ABR9BMD1_9GAMM|nr:MULTISPECIES: hypothetical protein [Photobacterium]MBD8513720.1 hypothetical protein [Photobacterium arenosum]MCG2839056.1 hypothetical protein [Photobacterium sp. WH77]MCG2846673.1 hypothetical protein [Photobacterium sp. WH80]MDO6582514.1 hypothetical protein [Photobacterium sp. 2_MG-2023]